MTTQMNASSEDDYKPVERARARAERERERERERAPC